MRLNTLSLLLATAVLTSPLHAQNWELTNITWLPDTTFDAPWDVPDPDPDPDPDPHPHSDCLCSPMFEDLTVHAPYYHTDSFVSHGIKFEVAPFQWGSGAFTTGGKVFADNAGAACGTDQDLMTNNANVKIFFPEGVASSVYWAFGEYGGNINLVINGDFRNVRDYRDLDGMVVGGVTVNVLSGGWGDDCGCVQLRGMVYELAVGGQEHWMDCLQYCCPDEHDEPNPGDNPDDQGGDDHDDHGDDNGDGQDEHGDDNGQRHDDDRNDNRDLLRKKGDVTRDGSTDVNDLMELFSKFGTEDAEADLDANGWVDVRDLIEILSGMQTQIGIPPEPEFAGGPGGSTRIEPNPSPSPMSNPTPHPSPVGIAPLPSP